MAAFQPQVPEWHIVERQDIKRLERLYKFKNFAEAMAFTDKLAHSPSLRRTTPPS